MSDNQQFCLRWNNHQSTLVQVIDSLLSSGVLVDCTLAAEGQYLHAHKVVLCACSPYLETLLSQHYEKHPIVILKDVKFQELKSMMDYMYKGEVNISQDQLGQFLKAAESLQIKGLTDGGGGENDSRDVGSTSQKRHDPPPIRKSVPHNQSRSPVVLPSHAAGLTIEPSKRSLPSHLSESQPDSPIRSREGSSSPTPRKRRRPRRPSQGDDDGHQDNCDLPMQQQSILNTVPIIPQLPAGSSSTITKAPPPDEEPDQPAESDNRLAESGLLKEKIEPQSELLIEPKTEYMEETNNDDSVEDLTLDDDDEYDGMDAAGPSHGGDNSNQSYGQWQMGERTHDEVFMAAQEAVGGPRDSQENTGKKDGTLTRLSPVLVLQVNDVNESKVQILYPVKDETSDEPVNENRPVECEVLETSEIRVQLPDLNINPDDIVEEEHFLTSIADRLASGNIADNKDIPSSAVSATSSKDVERPTTLGVDVNVEEAIVIDDDAETAGVRIINEQPILIIDDDTVDESVEQPVVVASDGAVEKVAKQAVIISDDTVDKTVEQPVIIASDDTNEQVTEQSVEKIVEQPVLITDNGTVETSKQLTLSIGDDAVEKTSSGAVSDEIPTIDEEATSVDHTEKDTTISNSTPQTATSLSHVVGEETPIDDVINETDMSVVQQQMATVVQQPTSVVDDTSNDKTTAVLISDGIRCEDNDVPSAYSEVDEEMPPLEIVDTEDPSDEDAPSLDAFNSETVSPSVHSGEISRTMQSPPIELIPNGDKEVEADCGVQPLPDDEESTRVSLTEARSDEPNDSLPPASSSVDVIRSVPTAPSVQSYFNKRQNLETRHERIVCGIPFEKTVKLRKSPRFNSKKNTKKVGPQTGSRKSPIDSYQDFLERRFNLKPFVIKLNKFRNEKERRDAEKLSFLSNFNLKKRCVSPIIEEHSYGRSCSRSECLRPRIKRKHVTSTSGPVKRKSQRLTPANICSLKSVTVELEKLDDIELRRRIQREHSYDFSSSPLKL